MVLLYSEQNSRIRKYPKPYVFCNILKYLRTTILIENSLHNTQTLFSAGLFYTFKLNWRNLYHKHIQESYVTEQLHNRMNDLMLTNIFILNSMRD